MTVDSLPFIWPTNRGLDDVIVGFEAGKNGGLDIFGKAGAAVMASADGTVTYSGSGLRGYGNLIIIKHTDTFMTAYAHNQTLLVKEGQLVSQGQKIAEMGITDTDKVKLHFELRKQGKPVDPGPYIPGK